MSTNFPHGVLGPNLNGGVGNPWSTHWYVDGNLGSDSRYSGEGPDSTLATMAEAFTRIKSGDVIHVRGNIREQISTPAGIFDVTIVGGGNQPRHADAHTSNNGYTSVTWKTPAAPTTAPLLIVQQQGWRIVGILFDGPADAAAVQLFRDAGAGDAERDAGHTWIQGCKFVAGQNHIEFKGGLSQCVIEDNLFFGATADSFLETVGAGVGTNNYHRILRNEFHNNASHIDVGLNYASINGNTFGAASGDRIDLRTGSNNMLTLNKLTGTYSNVGGYYAAGVTDDWSGNFNILAGGVTAANPA